MRKFYITFIFLFISLNVYACTTDGIYPDRSPECTPGSVYEDVTLEAICTPGYSKTVRHTTSAMKREVYEKYNIPIKDRKLYVLDHLISLQLGGRDSIDNLFPQRKDPKPNSRDKDRIENFLKRSICKLELTLQEAQEMIKDDWLDVYTDYIERGD